MMKLINPCYLMPSSQTIASLNTDTTNTNGTIAKIFNQQKVEGEVQATQQITQAFSQVAPKAIADYSSSKHEELMTQAKLETNPTQQQELLNEAAKWDEGGIYRVALHTVSGGVSGGVGGAVGAGVSAATIPEVGKAIDTANLPKEVKEAMVAIAGTTIGAVAGAATGGSTNNAAISGATTAYGQTVNNYLSHPQKDQRDTQLKNCGTNQQCINTVNAYWGKVDKEQTWVSEFGKDVWQGLKGGYNGLNYIMNLNPNEHPEISPFIIMLQTKGADTNFEQKGMYLPKIIDSAKYFSPLNINNTVNVPSKIQDATTNLSNNTNEKNK